MGKCWSVNTFSQLIHKGIKGIEISLENLYADIGLKVRIMKSELVKNN